MQSATLVTTSAMLMVIVQNAAFVGFRFILTNSELYTLNVITISTLIASLNIPTHNDHFLIKLVVLCN